MRRLALAVALALVAGCQATAGGEISITQAGKATKATAKVRSIEVKVVAPAQLATAGGNILTDAGAGLIKGGQILTDAGAGLVSRRGLFAAIDQFKAVKAAGVQAVGLDGKAIGGVGATDEDGGVRLADLPVGKAVSVIAAFKTGGKVYRLAATLGGDAFDGTLLLDPINTMVEARVRDLLRGKEAPAITNARLKRVWGICNKAEITLDPKDLEAGRPLAELTAALNGAWQAAIDAKVTSAAEKAEIAAFIAELDAAGKQ